jgi:hypothetical protein
MTLFLGFTLKDDRTTLAGLPNPIHEGVRVLNSHMYRSLAELQIEVRSVDIFPRIFSMPILLIVYRPQKTITYVISNSKKDIF